MTSTEQRPELAAYREFCHESFGSQLELLKRLVDQNSHTQNCDGVNSIQDILEAKLAELGFCTYRIAFSDRGDSLVAETHPGRRDCICFVGHADTVHRPESTFRGYVDDGEKARGPGVYDMKAGLIQMLMALEALRQQGRLADLPIKVIINSAEEDSTNDTQAALREHAQGARMALVFEFGRDGGGLVIERKGMAVCELAAIGLKAHAGNSLSDGANAIVALASVISQVASNTNLETGITVNVGSIIGGESINVVPDHASCGLEVRACTTEDLERVLNALAAINLGILPDQNSELAGLVFSVKRQVNPLEASAATRNLAADYIAASAEIDYPILILPRSGGLSDANALAGLDIPVVDAIGPLGGGAHTDSEYLEKETIVPRTMALINFLDKLPKFD